MKILWLYPSINTKLELPGQIRLSPTIVNTLNRIYEKQFNYRRKNNIIWRWNTTDTSQCHIYQIEKKGFSAYSTFF